ncbi:MAG: CBS domain-containing protein [Myxococcales bacterium]|nr:CBS domain-containing protein [Myxococcales bacterium]
MTADVATVGPDVMLSVVARKLAERRISALAVVDDKGAPLGVISRTDLVRIGRSQAGTHRKASALTLPEKRASELLSELARPAVITSPTTSVRDAARVMCEQRVHRLFVVDDRKITGVISTLDLMSAVCDEKIEIPLAEIMSTPLFSVTAQQPISVAIERLEHARVTGLVVIDDEWPVGVFTQVEAMESRDLPRDTRIDEVFDTSMLCLPTTTKVYRAAAQARRLEVRRVIACRDREAVGIVTGFDFAKLVAA